MARCLSLALTENAGNTGRILDRFIPEENGTRLQQAMRYSLFPGGKRIRPFLTAEFSRLYGGDPETAAYFSAAVECVHSYSLIHDDLPCMDDDDVRRGRPSCHIAFGEAEALLAGDALLTLAFEIISRSPCSPDAAIRAAGVLSAMSGAGGMAGGQSLDLKFASVGDVPYEDFLRMIGMKTGCLIRAACLLGAVAAGKTDKDPEYISADAFGKELGLAFQIEDDLLDDGDGGTTFLRYVSRDEASKLSRELTKSAKSRLPEGPEADILREFADSLTGRAL